MALLLANTPQKQLLVTGKWFPHLFVYTNEYIHKCIQREIEERSKVIYKTRKKTVKVFICSELGANKQSLGSQHLQQIKIQKHPDSEIFYFQSTWS